MTEAEVRTATEAEAEDILRCLLSAFAPYRDQYTPAGFHDTVLDRDRLQMRMRQMHIMISCLRGEIIGTIAGAVGENGEGHLRGMAVLPRFHGSGVAKKLLGAIEEWLHRHGCSRITLDTTEPLLPAMKFYEKHGYARSGRIADFFGMRLIEYEKKLSQSG